MAFNPFDAFRKNSKTMMAALTIFVMFIFVFSSGGGGGADFFDWIARAFGAADARGPVLGTIDGTDYHRRNLEELRLKRAAANTFMIQAVVASDEHIVSQIDSDLKNGAVKSPEAARWLGDSIKARRNLFGDQKRDRMDFVNQLQQYEFMSFFLNSIATQVNAKDFPNENRSLRRMQRVVQNDIQRISRANRDSALHFDAIQNSTQEDALQFAMYLNMANKMSIKLSDDDIKKLIADETEGQLSAEKAGEIYQNVLKNRFHGMSTEQIFNAIGDEFRVVAAMKILSGGFFSGRPSLPAAMTPYEFFEFYKDRCSSATFQVIDISAENFIPQVKGEPTDAEMNLLFDKYRNSEYDPARETPGFKEPRKIRIEYIAIDSSKPVYKQAFPAIQAATTIGAGFGSTFIGVGAVPSVMNMVGPLIADPLTIKEEVRIEMMHRDAQGFGIVWHGVPNNIIASRDTSVYHPLPAAALGAQLATMNNLNSLATATAGYRNLIDLVETRDRVALGMQMWFAPFDPYYSLTVFGPFFANKPHSGPTDPNFVFSKDPKKPNLHVKVDPSGVYALQAAEGLTKNRATAIAQKDLESFEKKLEELRKSLRKDPDETKKDETAKKEPPKLDDKKIDEANKKAAEIVKEWLKDHPGAVTGSNPKPLDKFRIVDDPALKGAFAGARDQSNFSQLVQGLFYRDPGKEPLKASLYEPWVLADFGSNRPEQSRRDFSKPVYASWKVEDLPAKTFTRLDQAPPELKAEIVLAWKLDKARAIAKEAADKFAEDVRALAQKQLRDANNMRAFDTGVADKVDAGRFKYLFDTIRLATLERVAAKRNPFDPQAREEPIRYQAPTLSNKEILYPAPGMAQQLLAVHDKPVGEVVVTADVPKSHYYVSILVNKEEKHLSDFALLVFRNSNVPPDRRQDVDPLFSQHANREAQRDFLKDITLRIKSETKYKETDEMKKQNEKSPEPGEQ